MKKTHDSLRDSIHTVETLERQVGHEIADAEKIRKIAEKFPIRITPYYLKLIDWDDPDDPLRRRSTDPTRLMAARSAVRIETTTESAPVASASSTRRSQ